LIKPVVLLCAVLALLVTSVGGVTAAPSSTVDRTSAIVQLTGEPLSTSPRTRPANGRKIDFTRQAVKSERAALAQIRNDFKRWLSANAPKVQITGSYDIAIHAVSVKLNGTSLTKIRTAPQVVSASLESVFRPLAHEDPDLTLVRAQEAWNAVGGPANAGQGVKVAVIDSGIDITHPCFNDAGYPSNAQLGDPDLTNNKVIVAKVFNNKASKLGVDASDLNGHGTHVAGTIACNVHTPANVNGVDIPYDPSGVAPAAMLGNYNVFPGTVGEARSEDILNALEEAYEDGFDVANMSLGGARNDGGGAFLLDNAIDNLDRANMVIAVAAGNEGPGYWTVHYPGAAPRALTAGASTVGHAIVNILTVDGTDYEAVVGEFKVLDSDLTAPLAVVSDPASGFPHNLNLACDDSPALPDLTGTIALLGRGTCDFTVKMRNAQNAGADGVIMVNRIPGEAPFVMAHNGLEPQPTIPGYMVSLEDGAAIDDHDGDSATLRALGVYVTRPDDTNLMASFSSQGPTHGDMLIKPDVVAPGADVLSAQPAWTCNEEDADPKVPCWAFFGGTSMATPHLAGAAAVVRGDHPTWTAAQVRSAVTNTAQQNILTHPETDVVTNDALIVGAGLLDVEAAVGASVAVDPVSKSFGSVSSGSGKDLTATVVLTNVSGSAATYSLAVSDTAADGATFSVGSSSATLAAGASATISVRVDTNKGTGDGFKQAQLNISAGGSEVAHAMLLVLVGEGDAAPGQHMVPVPHVQ
jgi:minor extracellular serine protease Vpr